MISKDYGKYALICDICGEGTEEVFDTFQEAADARESNGWKSKKLDGHWADVCPDCLEVD